MTSPMSEIPAPSVGTVIVKKWRVLGISKVWPDKFVVCEILTGENAGERRLLDAHDFRDAEHLVID